MSYPIFWVYERCYAEADFTTFFLYPGGELFEDFGIFESCIVLGFPWEILEQPGPPGGLLSSVAGKVGVGRVEHGCPVFPFHTPVAFK